MDTPLIAIFDVGKTNKKLFLFDEHYHIVYEETTQLSELTDEDGDACEDLSALTLWITSTFKKLTTEKQYNIKACDVERAYHQPSGRTKATKRTPRAKRTNKNIFVECMVAVTNSISEDCALSEWAGRINCDDADF